ncbi:MAG: IS1 family transposase [Gloeocapsa sp. UFS-A4-WI-NPMV-4B04]|nr:IS1 family transposase [Gloeocapsa sp. UFS-A4-WI-NPMV-4B04]
MKCPQCHSSNLRKDGYQNGKQRFECKDCGRLLRDSYEARGYRPQLKKICLEMYLNGMEFRAIERVTGIHHTTIMNWVKESAQELPEDKEEQPTVAELDELQTYVGRRIDKVWLWTAINHHAPGILAMEIGDRSGQTFAKLWQRIETWKSRRYLTDGYCVYANYIDPKKHLVLPKILLTRVEGENTRLRHYLARLHRATLCYSKSLEMLRCSVRLLMHYLRFRTIPLAT